MPPYSYRRLLWVGPVATLAAILADEAYYFITRALGEQYLIPLDGSSTHLAPMPALAPVLVILIPGLIASALFGLMLRFVNKPVTVFLSVSVAALLLSFGGPFNLPSATTQTKILLSGMHVIAAIIITGGILLLDRPKNKVP